MNEGSLKTAEEQARPYLSYYAAHGISPVNQEIKGDLAAHYRRRAALYHFLGLSAGLLRGKAAIEFGPGSGHNALYTASLGLSRYTLVDGNPVGASETQTRLAAYFGDRPEIEIKRSLIEEFCDDARYDVVFCEGVIPFQRDPAAFARHVAGFANAHGVVVVTCIDAISGLGEFCRRLIANKIIPFSAPSAERLRVLAPVFAPHLETLTGRTRPVEDWIHDNILIPYHGRLFSIADAIECLQDSFDLYGGSPRFATDWRWYKDCGADDALHNAAGLSAYFSNLASFADYRATAPAHDEKVGRRLLQAAENVFSLMCEHETGGQADALPAAARALAKVAALLENLSPTAAQALKAAANFVLADGAPDYSHLEPVRGYFGRGQQYLSFARRTARQPQTSQP